jgi:hypothetical protein
VLGERSVEAEAITDVDGQELERSNRSREQLSDECVTSRCG